MSEEPTHPEGRPSGRPKTRSKRPTIEQTREINEGDRFGRFIVLEKLGQGGMGVVFAAYDTDLDRRVAIKLLRSDGELKDAGARSRLIREAKALAKLAHPNVVTVYEVGEVGEQVFIVMELVDGQTLSQWCKEDRTWDETLPIMLAAARGLSAAHEAELVHRDFKPDNVIIGSDGRVRVVDFGVVGRLGAVLDLTRGGTGGTPPYMAPEQHRGEAIDGRADQFAFCVTLFEALFGVTPFEGDAETVRERILSGEMVAIPRDHNVPRHVVPILRRGLSVDRKARFKSLESIAAALAYDPRKRRRRQLAFGLGAAAVVLVAAGWPRGEQHSVCVAANDLAGVWDATLASSVKVAFGGADPRAGGDAFVRVNKQLDEYAKRWRVQHARACAETKESSTSANALAELSCLTRRRHELAALTAALSRTDNRKLVEKAQLSTKFLSAPESCRSSSASVAATGERQRELRARLYQAEALRRVGKYTESRRAAEALATDISADNLKQDNALDNALEIETLILLGRVRGYVGDSDGAEKVLAKAVPLAAKEGLPELEAHAIAELAWVIAYYQGRAQESLSMHPLLEAALLRAPNSPALEARVAFLRGVALVELGRYDEAKIELERSRGIAETKLDPLHPDAIRTLLTLGNVAGYQGQPDRAIELFRLVLSRREQSLGREHPHVVGPLINLGNALARNDKAKEAIPHCTRALKLEGEVLGEDHPALASSLKCLASAHHALGDETSAASHFERALELGKKDAIGAGLFYIRCEAGKFELDRGNNERALEHCELAHKEFAAEGLFEHPDMARALTCRGRAQLALGKRKLAQQDLEAALAIREKISGDRARAETRFHLARALPEGSGRARELAELAREEYQRANAVTSVAAVDAWLGR